MDNSEKKRRIAMLRMGGHEASVLLAIIQTEVIQRILDTDQMESKMILDKTISLFEIIQTQIIQCMRDTDQMESKMSLDKTISLMTEIFLLKEYLRFFICFLKNHEKEFWKSEEYQRIDNTKNWNFRPDLP